MQVCSQPRRRTVWCEIRAGFERAQAGLETPVELESFGGVDTPIVD
jgi:hypothetical protein